MPDAMDTTVWMRKMQSCKMLSSVYHEISEQVDQNLSSSGSFKLVVQEYIR
jgi:hypothetical protein